MNALQAEPLATRLYFDREFGMAAVKLLPGEYYVTAGNMVMTTVLGSCVSACLRDSVTGIGGMNHFMLPDAADALALGPVAAMRYGEHAMQVLLSEVMRAGARREPVLLCQTPLYFKSRDVAHTSVSEVIVLAQVVGERCGYDG